MGLSFGVFSEPFAPGRSANHGLASASSLGAKGLRRSAVFKTSVLLFSGLLAGFWSPLSAQSISLGQAGSFAVLGNSTVTNAGATTVVGNLGLSPGTAVTGFPPGNIVNGTLHISDALAVSAQHDALLAYNALVAVAPTTNLSGQDLGGMTLL